MAVQSLETQVLSLEKRYWTALREKDTEAALELTCDPCIVAGASGVSQVDHKAFAKMMDSAPWSLESFELDDVKVRMVADDVAIVAYTVKESLTVDGKPLELEAADASTWIRSDGIWKCALHTEAISGDPFGRDRAPAT
jgi:ketosteroid isomerase-like protein